MSWTERSGHVWHSAYINGQHGTIDRLTKELQSSSVPISQINVIKQLMVKLIFTFIKSLGYMPLDLN